MNILSKFINVVINPVGAACNIQCSYCYIKTNGIVSQLQQKEIGFVYSAHDLISLSVLPTVTITFIKSGSGLLPNDKTDKHTVEAQLLGASVLSGQQIIYSAAPTMGFEWDKVEISFGGLSEAIIICLL